MSEPRCTLPRTVLLASWAPGNDAFAYIGRDYRPHGKKGADERLYVGATPATADRVVHLPETSPIGEFLAWRDADHVVLGNYRRDVYVVDIRNGSYETIDMAGGGEQVNTPLLATSLWAAPLGAATIPTGTTDPRRPWRLSALFVGALIVIAAGVRLWRRRQHPQHVLRRTG